MSDVVAASKEARISVPNSTGTAAPALHIPEGATDCHVHIYDPRFALPVGARAATENASVADYRALQERVGTTRVVIVHARNYGTDNRVTLDALAQLGGAARGVAVVTPAITDEELVSMHMAGIRGIRFSLTDPSSWVVTPDMMEPLAHRVAPLGWHVQICMDADRIAQSAPLLARLPAPIVFDHLGIPAFPDAISHPSHRVLLDLLDKGRAWVKLSGAYLNKAIGAPYREMTQVARSFVEVAPDRLVWGSDWPHPSVTEKPDDAQLIDLLGEWAPDLDVRRRILVDNPAVLYDF